MAPDKIYLEWYRIGDKKYREWVITPKTNNENVEYIRKDVFIEKAINYLANNMQCDGYTLQTKGRFIRNFKKYLDE